MYWSSKLFLERILGSYMLSLNIQSDCTSKVETESKISNKWACWQMNCHPYTRSTRSIPSDTLECGMGKYTFAIL